MTVTETGVVGSLQEGLPTYVSDPPIEAVCFAYGVSEDGQLVRHLSHYHPISPPTMPLLFFLTIIFPRSLLLSFRD